MPRYARVIPDRAGDRALDYVIPEALMNSLAPGSRVRVPLRARLVLATVVEVLDASTVKSPREIHEVIGGTPLIRPRLLEIARWISEYYCCPLETAMACVLPQVVRQAKISPRRLNLARLARRASAEEMAALARKAPRQADALRAVQEAGSPRPVVELVELAGVNESVFRALERNGWVAIEAADVARDPFSGETFLPTSDLALNAEQSLAVEAIKEAIEAPARPLLLFGVTGSGKTEIYLQAIRHAISLGRTALTCA
jgi:primosomal protein N' (replication factor Y)